MSLWLDLPSFGLIAGAIVVLVTDVSVRPLEHVLAFFGVGDVNATIATAELLAAAGLAGLGLNRASSAAGRGEAADLALNMLTALFVGIAVVWIDARLSAKDE